jgi:hypothetical protein
MKCNRTPSMVGDTFGNLSTIKRCCFEATTIRKLENNLQIDMYLCNAIFGGLAD